MDEPIILASASPRRHELLSMIGLPYEVHAPEVDESETGSPDGMVLRLAQKKARAAAAVYPGRVILAADTLVYAKGEVLGKPRDEADALRMIGLLRDDWHEVYTGVCVIDRSGHEHTGADKTAVHFMPISDDEIRAYVNGGEPFGKAGAYAIQGVAGAFISGIEGSYSNVIGLPLHLVKALLGKADIKLL